jgi:hypothetical protein
MIVTGIVESYLVTGIAAVNSLLNVARKRGVPALSPQGMNQRQASV